MDPMTATIHFVGLVMFTTQPIRTDTARIAVNATPYTVQQTVALMPKVLALPQQRARAGRSEVGPESALPIGGQHVEEHIALIAFKSCDLLAVSGWEVKRLDNDFLYVQLNGDHVSFVVDGVNGPAKIDPNLRHVVGSHLIAPYAAPYSGEAAVFTIPRGSLKACFSKTTGVVPQNRVDTQLTLANNGTLTIKTDVKSITLTGNAVVAAANVPIPWAMTHTQTTSALPHYTVYCAMTGDTACVVPAPTAGLDDCDSGINLRPAGGSGELSTRTVPSSVDSIDAFCSTTQWP